jgi:small subunit ribosomal protein S25e
MKAITAYSTAKALGINVSMASTLIKNLENRGILEKVGGYSGHYVYQYLSKSIK